MNEAFDYGLLDEIVTRQGGEKKAIIAILQDVQEHFRYLPKEVFPYIAKKINMSEAGIYSVATFYENFSLEPKGKFVLKVCDGTACHLRKSIPILQRLRKELSLAEGQITTEDLSFTVETVSCLGSCSLAPVLMVNETVYPAMTPDKASELIQRLKEEI